MSHESCHEASARPPQSVMRPTAVTARLLRESPPRVSWLERVSARPRARGGGGGGHFHIDGDGDVPLNRVWFSRLTVIHINTGHLNGPNWLLRLSQGCFLGFPPGSQPQCLWQARDLGTSDGACGTKLYDRPAISAPASTVRPGRNRFLWMYDSWYIGIAERFETGSGFRPPSSTPPPPPHGHARHGPGLGCLPHDNWQSGYFETGFRPPPGCPPQSCLKKLSWAGSPYWHTKSKFCHFRIQIAFPISETKSETLH